MLRQTAMLTQEAIKNNSFPTSLETSRPVHSFRSTGAMARTILFLLLLFPGLALQSSYGQEIMQPLVYKEGMDVSGWLMSEKLDGVRGYWDGRQLLSKTGIPLHPPPAFTVNFPYFAVEGEIWGGRGSFEKTSGTVRKQAPHDGWRLLKFAIFDVPGTPGGFEERLARAKAWFDRHPTPYAFIIPHQPVRNEKHLRQELQRIESLDGEGIILRKAGSRYTVGRSPDILKVKSYDDSEAVVIAHIGGKGRNADRMGALLVELPESGMRFKIGTGFSDKERENPPAIGSQITFKYYGFYESGIPKFPSFLRVRAVH